MGDINWVPLESNPDVMNKFLHNLGVPKSFAMVDVLGFDKELQLEVPKPVGSVLLLFPTGEKHEEYSKQQAEDIKANGQTINEKVYYMRQTIKNACGTVALIHAVANASLIELDNESTLGKFLEATKDGSPDERGAELEKTKTISEAHQQSAREGQTQAPSADDVVDLHFVAFVHVDGNLYELDGRKATPINHGTTTQETLLEDASTVCRDFLARDPDNLNFSLMALAPAET